MHNNDIVQKQALIRPEYIRLPKPGSLCPHTGLTRSKLNELVLPCRANGRKPPVKSISLKAKHQIRGVRLILFESLLAHLKSFGNASEAKEGISNACRKKHRFFFAKRFNVKFTGAGQSPLIQHQKVTRG